VWGLPRRCRAVSVPAVRPPAAMPWAGAVTALRRARLLVSGAAVTAVATAVFLALFTAALVAGWGGGPAAGYGSAAFGAADLAVGLLVLARAGAVARTDAARGRALRIRCVWALFAVLAVFIVGGVAGYLTRACAHLGEHAGRPRLGRHPDRSGMLRRGSVILRRRPHRPLGGVR